MAHHLVLGELRDIITGETIPDTHDERYRQQISELLLNEKGFTRQQLAVRRRVAVQTDTHRLTAIVDWIVTEQRRAVMLLCYAPGSIVSRERPTVALARIIEPYVVPLAVITNGRDAHLLDAESGKVRARGLAVIPTRNQLLADWKQFRFSRLEQQRAAAERRIVTAFQALDCGC